MLRSKAVGMGVCFHKGLVLGNMGGHSFPRAFERRVKFFYQEKDMSKKAPEMGNSLHKGLHWGTWSEFVFRDF